MYIVILFHTHTKAYVQLFDKIKAYIENNNSLLCTTGSAIISLIVFVKDKFG